MAEQASNVPEKAAKNPTAVAKRSDIAAFAEYLVERAAIESPMVAKELSDDQTQRILAATTEEELEAAMEMLGVVGLREVPNGTVVQFNGYHVVPGTRSEFANRFGVFAVIDATMLTKTERFGNVGTNVMLDTGVERIIAWLRAIESGQINNSDFPVQRIVVKVPAGSGEMITLKRLPDPIVKGESVK